VSDKANAKSVIFFSSDDWESGLKTSKYHMATLLAADGFNVLYVNSIGLRRPTLSTGTAKKIVNRLKTIFRGVRRVSDHIHVMTPFVVPFHGHPWVNRLNRLLLVLGVRRMQRKLRMREPELWLFLPNHADLVGAFGESASVYYVVDEHALFDDVDHQAMQALDDRLTRSVTLLVGTARSLLASRANKAKNALYLPHGVDVGHFRSALAETTAVPAEIAGLAKPVVGFFGLIEEWIDLDLVAAAARRHPEWSFVMIGKVVVDLQPFADIPNLHFLGPKPYVELPGYCKGFDCAILPFRITDMTVHVNPLKMREYLAAGLPVVSTDLPEVRGYSDLVRISKSPEEFIADLEKSLAAPPARTEVSGTMDNETWNGRYRELRTKLNSLRAGA
jgi:glycosyltransferase involved in cell wall biosynthesis